MEIAQHSQRIVCCFSSVHSSSAVTSIKKRQFDGEVCVILMSNVPTVLLY